MCTQSGPLIVITRTRRGPLLQTQYSAMLQIIVLSPVSETMSNVVFPPRRLYKTKFRSVNISSRKYVRAFKFLSPSGPRVECRLSPS